MWNYKLMSERTGKVRTAFRSLREDGVSTLGRNAFNVLQNQFGARLAELLAARGNVIDDGELRESVARRTFRYADEEVVEIGPNAAMRPLPDRLQSYLGQYRTAPRFAAELREPTLHESSFVFDSTGRVVFNSIGSCRWLYARRILAEGAPSTYARALFGRPLSSQIPNATERVEKGFNLVRFGSYYHWLTESLPALRALERYDEATGTSIPVLVEPDPPDWMLDYLSLAGLEDRVVPLPAESVTVGTLVTSPRQIRIRECFNPSTRDLEWTGQRFREMAGVDSCSSSERIFVSREDGNGREIAERAALFENLASLGFEKHRLTDYSVPEQIRLFADAECIVGAHGAGLTNALYTDHTRLFEIVPDSWYWHDFYCLCEQLGFEYDYYRAPQGAANSLRIDVETVTERVESLLD